ncbi:MAG: hypothetical protein LBU35_01350, partial [Holosporales bacterium]|nr:hypothetical protein [Holosporales bacterium]
MNRSLIISAVFLVLIGITVSRIKYEVVFLRKSLANLDKEIETCNDDIKVLRAEWGCLNEPSRLKKLCEKYLKSMKSIENSQMMDYDKIIGRDYEEQNQINDDA